MMFDRKPSPRHSEAMGRLPVNWMGLGKIDGCQFSGILFINNRLTFL
jgi:hypothetical protein